MRFDDSLSLHIRKKLIGRRRCLFDEILIWCIVGIFPQEHLFVIVIHKRAESEDKKDKIIVIICFLELKYKIVSFLRFFQKIVAPDR